MVLLTLGVSFQEAFPSPSEVSYPAASPFPLAVPSSPGAEVLQEAPCPSFRVVEAPYPEVPYLEASAYPGASLASSCPGAWEAYLAYPEVPWVAYPAARPGFEEAGWRYPDICLSCPS